MEYTEEFLKKIVGVGTLGYSLSKIIKESLKRSMLNGNCILVGKNANVPCLALTWCGGMALLHCAFASVGKKKEKVKCGITVGGLAVVLMPPNRCYKLAAGG